MKPQLGESGFFCLELFCGTGNLTYAMKHFFPDSFGIDHKVNKQKVKVVCLDLTKEDHQDLVEQWALSGRCLWVHFGVPCGTASRARFRRISRQIHGPPPLRTPQFPDGKPGLTGLHAVKLRAANRLYSYMRRLIKQLHAKGIVWTVENPLTSLLWETSYWKDIEKDTDPFYCELHNCMFGGKRLKRTCLASNCSAVMSLNILCDGQHEHAPWSINNGVFDTSLEAEYTPCLAKALATAVLEGISGQYKLPHVAQHAKKLKLSHFHAIAAAKQPTRALQLPTVPEFSHIVVLSNLPCHFAFSFSNSVLQQCLNVTWLQQCCTIPCQSRILRATNKKGGEIRRFKLSVEHTQSLKSLSDTGQSNPGDDNGQQLRGCAKVGDKCSSFSISLDDDSVTGDCCDWVFGIRWTPEEFVSQAVAVGHPFMFFSGLPAEVKDACVHVAESEEFAVINNRCSKLGEWLRLSKKFHKEESALKSEMPADRK